MQAITFEKEVVKKDKAIAELQEKFETLKVEYYS